MDVDFDTRDVPSASGFKQRPNPPSEAVEVVRKSHSPTEEGGYSSTVIMLYSRRWFYKYVHFPTIFVLNNLYSFSCQHFSRPSLEI